MQLAWKEHGGCSVFGNELGFAKEDGLSGFFSPLPFSVWLVKNKAEDLLFKSLDKLCPLLPSNGYGDRPSIHLSPPPSGYETSTFIIIGKDSKKKLRAIGSNSVNPNFQHLSKVNSENVFDTFDTLANPSDITELISTVVFKNMGNNEKELLKKHAIQADKFRTMAVVILVLDKDKPHFGIDLALVRPTWSSSNLDYEFAGEIK